MTDVISYRKFRKSLQEAIGEDGEDGVDGVAKRFAAKASAAIGKPVKVEHAKAWLYGTGEAREFHKLIWPHINKHVDRHGNISGETLRKAGLVNDKDAAHIQKHDIESSRLGESELDETMFSDLQKVHRNKSMEGKEYTVHRIRKDGTPGPTERERSRGYGPDRFSKAHAHALKKRWNELNPGSKYVVKTPDGKIEEVVGAVEIYGHEVKKLSKKHASESDPKKRRELANKLLFNKIDHSMAVSKKQRQQAEEIEEAAGDEEYKKHRISQGISAERFKEIAHKHFGAPKDTSWYHRDDSKTGNGGGWYQKHTASWKEGDKLHDLEAGHTVAGGSGAYIAHRVHQVSHTKGGNVKFKPLKDRLERSDKGIEDALTKLK